MTGFSVVLVVVIGFPFVIPLGMTTEYAYSILMSTWLAYPVGLPCVRLWGMTQPAPLTPDEKTRLAQYEDTPDENKNDTERLDELDLLTRRQAYDKHRAMTLIPGLFEGAPRGRLTAVVKASGYTREYVARIRDGKVKR